VTSLSARAVGSPSTISQLDALAAELAGHLWAARLEAPADRLPRLHVQNPAVPALSEYVYAQPRRDGTWTYWWQGAQPIAGAAAEAAAIIISSLQADGDNRPAVPAPRPGLRAQTARRTAGVA
jgi:hypothetical protein